MTTRSTSRERCAAAVMEVGLLVSRLVRAQSWRQRPQGLSVAQFRTLTYVNAYPNSAPSEVAEYLMLSRPAITRIVGELARRRLVARRVDPRDRRRQTLVLTAAGRHRLDTFFAAARALVGDRLAALSATERATVTRAMELLRPHLATRTRRADAPRR